MDRWRSMRHVDQRLKPAPASGSAASVLVLVCRRRLVVVLLYQLALARTLVRADTCTQAIGLINQSIIV